MRLRIAAFIAAGLLVHGCATQAPPPPPAPAGAPRLVVFIAVDGLPQRQVLGYRDQLAPDGLARFLDRGAWFADAHHGHSFTVTAAGHAVMLTGAYPHRTGIVGNDWRDPRTGESEYCTSDPSHKYIGAETDKHDGTSPRKLLVETVGDVLRGANARSKVIAISGKDRGAILLAGHKGVAYMYQDTNGTFASSTYYMAEHPRWAAEWNAAKPADRYFKAEWKPLLEDSAYARSLRDNQKWYARGGALPKVIGEPAATSPDGKFYSALLATPFIDELTLDFVRAAIAGEGLGQDDAPDILALSLSGHDYVNHSWSAESRLSHDHLLRLDRALQDFFRHLDERVGRDSYVAVLTADHGFTIAPEVSASQGQAAQRYNSRDARQRINRALSARFGEGSWILGSSADGLVVNRTVAGQRGLVVDRLIEETRTILLREPVVEAAYTRAELVSGSRRGAPWFDRMERSFHPDRSGDVPFVIKRYWLIASGSGNAATHGSPHPEDSHVPIAFYGPAWVKAGRRDGRVEVADIAPTLAWILGVPAPSASEGKQLPIR